MGLPPQEKRKSPAWIPLPNLRPWICSCGSKNLKLIEWLSNMELEYDKK